MASFPNAATWNTEPCGMFPSQCTVLRSSSYCDGFMPSHFININTLMVWVVLNFPTRMAFRLRPVCMVSGLHLDFVFWFSKILMIFPELWVTYVLSFAPDFEAIKTLFVSTNMKAQIGFF